MKYENLAIGDKINYADCPELFGDELTFEQLLGEPSSSLLIAWRSAFAGSTVEDVKQAVICRIVRVLDVDEDDPFTATVMLDSGERSPFPIEYDDMEETEPMDEEQEKQHIWNLYDRIWKVKQEDKAVENIEHTEPEQAAEPEQETEPEQAAEIALTEKQQAEALHKQITSYGEVVYQSLYGMCTAIKQMRDSKLYKALGFDTFEGYTEDKLGIKRRQAYKYISIAENLAGDFVHSSAQIGIQKLYLLAQAPEETRAEITQTVDLESTTVRELKAQISALQAKNADTEKARLDAEERAQKWYDEAQDAKDAAKDAEEAKERNRLTLRGIIDKKVELVHQLEAQIKELESRPVEVAVPEPSHELQNMQDAMRRINLEHEQWSAKMQDDHIKHVQEINRQHRAETDALRAEYEEKLAAAQASPAETPEPDSKEVFKVYLAAVIDAAKRMMAFLSAHPDAACKAQAEKAFQTILQEVNNEQTV